jgi:protein-disulfide isomerase
MQHHQKLSLFSGAVFLAALAGLLIYSFIPKVSYDLWIKTLPLLGSSNAPVEMMIFEDFRCEECKEFSLHIMPLIEQNFIQTGKVKVYLIPLSIFGDTDAVAKIMVCLSKQNGNLGYAFIKNWWQSEVENEKERIDAALKPLEGDILEGLFLQGKEQLDIQKFFNQNYEMAKKLLSEDGALPSILIEGKELDDFNYFSIAKEIEKNLNLKASNG